MSRFSKTRMPKPGRSAFDLSHERKFTCDMGKLVPCFLSEVLPGDRFRVNLEALVRFQPMLAPIMHRVNVYTHFFFVPNRIIWNEWETFITGGLSGDQEPNFPKLTGSNADFEDNCFIGTLADYLGYPSQQVFPGNTDPGEPINILPFRAYQAIYNKYYRSQDLSDEIAFSTGSSDVPITSAEGLRLITMRNRCWEKDYFTSTLPTPQRGEDVRLPLVGSIQVTGRPLIKDSLGNVIDEEPLGTDDDGYLANSPWTKDARIVAGLTGELEDSTSTTIRDVRRAWSLQRFREKMMSGGARYIEQIRTMFGVVSSDARLQRPEYLGGGKMPVQISEVLQMSQTADTPQGNMSGHGYSSGVNVGFNRSFEEHGFVIGIMSIIPRTAYMQGLPRIFTKFDRFDYYWNDFAHIGDQPILNKELFLREQNAEEVDNDNNQVFGYGVRYQDYRYMFDTVHGDLRTNLDFWHLARKFDNATPPALNDSFVKCVPDTRIFPVIEEDPKGLFKKVIVQTYANFQAIRPVSKHGDPI